MNIERLTAIALWLEGGAQHEYITFDMQTGITVTTRGMRPTDIHACATSCCIAGYAVMQFNEPQALLEAKLEATPWVAECDKFDLPFFNSFEPNALSVLNEAEKVLDLERVVAKQLFCPHDFDGPSKRLRDYSDPAWAARTIRLLIAIGKVSWKNTMSEKMRQHLEARDAEYA